MRSWLGSWGIMRLKSKSNKEEHKKSKGNWWSWGRNPPDNSNYRRNHHYCSRIEWSWLESMIGKNWVFLSKLSKGRHTSDIYLLLMSSLSPFLRDIKPSNCCYYKAGKKRENIWNNLYCWLSKAHTPSCRMSTWMSHRQNRSSWGSLCCSHRGNWMHRRKERSWLDRKDILKWNWYRCCKDTHNIDIFYR